VLAQNCMHQKDILSTSPYSFFMTYTNDDESMAPGKPIYLGKFADKVSATICNISVLRLTEAC